MRILRFALLGSLVLGLSACSGSSSGKKESNRDGGEKRGSEGGRAGNADKIVGTWEVVKSAALPPGSKATIEFTKDGQMMMTVTFQGKTATQNATYKLSGDKLTTTMKGPDGKDKTETDTIKTLDDTNLILEDEKGKVEEWKRK